METTRSGDSLNPHLHGPLLRDRLRGALIGLAVGDAVGTTVEFRPPGSFPPVTDMTGGGPFNLQPGQWTDDTSMALCLAESLIAQQGFDARDQIERYVRWWRTGHLSSTGSVFDIGVTTADALRRYEGTGHPFAGLEDPMRAGNGSIMRLAPVAMFYACDPAAGIAACAQSSRTTHAAVVAVDACRYFGALLMGAFAGASKEALLSARYSPLPGYWERSPLGPEIAEIASGSFKRKSPPKIRGSGYAAESLEAALWAFHTTDDFQQGCLRAVNLGNDADTTAAVYGQIAGGYYGEEAIPEEWRAALALWPTIDAYAEELYRLAVLGGSGSA
jgi:ADP-ribosylglycohydrolase